jgi:cobalt/nickel transport system permease protein
LQHALERWSCRESPLHRRDPRAKALALLVFLVIVATTGRPFVPAACAYLALLMGALLWARLPLAGALARAAVVLPFTLVFALISFLAGDGARAVMLLGKSYLSALAVLLVVSTTPLPGLLHGLGMMGLPRFLLMVAQFVYRYLFVISEEAQHMRVAAVARGATLAGVASQGARFRAAAGALAVLFARSYARAEGIHRAMIARGFQGRFRLLSLHRFGWRDAAFVAAAVAAPAAVRLALEARV